MAINLGQVLTEFNAAGIDIAADFFTLSLSDAGRLCEIAKSQHYRKPKNANGSTARYFFAAVQRKHNRSRSNES